MENEFYKILSWHSKWKTSKYLAYAIYCFVMTTYYQWTFSMIAISYLAPRMLYAVARSFL
jgi:hypothetical protein